ncbi:MAG: hypothetical protein EZS28_000466 [Streblomastix strix]|uniref:inositol-1,3,4-trisphosphate 5/6-kinase n=1 Tax=Streblomastix strix TaxID=222440 RepID=A0A5J4XA65_9EUKA|nr:MAG: hypothetical protein EZS28_000466 [Streblomastix strix]
MQHRPRLGWYFASEVRNRPSTKEVLLRLRYIVQQLIEHHPVVHKVYTAYGEGTFPTLVASIPSNNFRSQKLEDNLEQEIFSFQTQIKFSFEDQALEIEHNLPPIPQDLNDYIADSVYQRLGIQLFGFDIIRSPSAPHDLSLVDINYYPNFKSAEQFDAIFRNITKRYNEWKKGS